MCRGWRPREWKIGLLPQSDGTYLRIASGRCPACVTHCLRALPTKKKRDACHSNRRAVSTRITIPAQRASRIATGRCPDKKTTRGDWVVFSPTSARGAEADWKRQSQHRYCQTCCAHDNIFDSFRQSFESKINESFPKCEICFINREIHNFLVIFSIGPSAREGRPPAAIVKKFEKLC